MKEKRHRVSQELAESERKKSKETQKSGPIEIPLIAIIDHINAWSSINTKRVGVKLPEQKTTINNARLIQKDK